MPGLAAENGLRWRPLLATIYGVTDRTVDTWVAEANESGIERLTRCREHDDSPPEADRHTGQTITLVFTPSATSNTNEASEPTRDVGIIGMWSDGSPQKPSHRCEQDIAGHSGRTGPADEGPRKALSRCPSAGNARPATGFVLISHRQTAVLAIVDR